MSEPSSESQFSITVGNSPCHKESVLVLHTTWEAVFDLVVCRVLGSWTDAVKLTVNGLPLLLARRCGIVGRKSGKPTYRQVTRIGKSQGVSRGLVVGDRTARLIGRYMRHFRG